MTLSELLQARQRADWISYEGFEKDGVFLYKPQWKQKVFHEAIANRDALELTEFLYGGAAKGGKSHALRWEGHNNCTNYAGVRGLLIRSSFPELDRSHLAIDKLPSDFGSDERVGIYNQNKHTFTYFNKSVMEFGYGDTEKDFKQYLSAEYDFILIDELTTIDFSLVIKLRSRLLARVPGFTPFLACATNPGDRSHREVKSFFIDRDFDVEFPELMSNYPKKAVCFIPATVHDNQIAIDRDPNILKRLLEMDEIDKKRFYYGSWELFLGQFFDKMMRGIHEIHASAAPDSGYIQELAAMDYGNYSIAFVGRYHKSGDLFVEHEWKEENMEMDDLANSYYKFLIRIGKPKVTTIGDTDMFNLPPKVYSRSDHKPVDSFRARGLKFVRILKKGDDQSKKFRIYSNRHVKNILNWKKNDKGLWLRKPKIYFLQGRCPNLWKTMPYLIADPNNDKDLDLTSGVHHPYDGLKMLAVSAGKPIREEAKTMKERLKEKLEAVRRHARV